jgi:hypothetical protein
MVRGATYGHTPIASALDLTTIPFLSGASQTALAFSHNDGLPGKLYQPRSVSGTYIRDTSGELPLGLHARKDQSDRPLSPRIYSHRSTATLKQKPFSGRLWSGYIQTWTRGDLCFLRHSTILARDATATSPRATNTARRVTYALLKMEGSIFIAEFVERASNQDDSTAQNASGVR